MRGYLRMCFDINDIEELSEGHTSNYSDYGMPSNYGNKGVKIDSKKSGIVQKKVLNDGSEYVVDSQIEEEDILGFGLQHIDNMKKADEYIKEHPEYIQDGVGTFYKELKKCSSEVKDIYASIFTGVVDLYCTQKLGEYQEDGGGSVLLTGDKADNLIALLITKSCADCLPRVCRPNIANGVQHGDYGVDFDLSGRDVYNCKSFDTYDIYGLQDDISILTNIDSPYEGIDAHIWAEHDDVMIVKDSLCKFDIRRGYYNELMVDVELYTNTPANIMFKKIYEILGSDKYRDMITPEYIYDRGDLDIDKFEVAKEALIAILNDTE